MLMPNPANSSPALPANPQCHLKCPKAFTSLLQFRAGLRIPSAALEERRNVGHDEAETVQNRPGDGNALKPCAGIIHGLAVLGKVHQQQGNGGTDNSCDGGDGDDLRVDILHDLAGFRPDGCAGCGGGRIILAGCKSGHCGQYTA